MPPVRTKPSPRASRRRRRAAALPDVPVVVPDATTAGAAQPAAQPQPVPDDDPVDDRIRRMIEAAYT